MPGPAPLYRPVFPLAFLTQAQKLVRSRTASAHLRQRAHLALLFQELPSLSNVEAGLRLGLHPNAVRRWRRRWASGQFTLEDQPGRGRKATFPPLGPGPRRRPRL
jgi:Homeodomain-like domain